MQMKLKRKEGDEGVEKEGKRKKGFEAKRGKGKVEQNKGEEEHNTEASMYLMRIILVRHTSYNVDDLKAPSSAINT
jgi:hypothetical protein